MKNQILACLLTLFSFGVVAQVTLPKGVEVLKGVPGKTSFLLKDRNNILWEGLGGFLLNGSRYNNGLKQYKDNIWKTMYTTGIFTDALEFDTIIYFTNYEGLYKYETGKFSIDYGTTKNTSITKFNNKLMVGTMGNGLSEKTGTGFISHKISINGKSYDSIYCLTASGNQLWIGTTNGLVLYDGTNFYRHDLPYKNSGMKDIIKDQQTVISIQKDSDGKVWVLNNNQQDSLDCLFFLEGGKFTNARDYYSKQCIGRIMIPYSASKLTLGPSGYPVIGIGIGIIEYGKDSIRSSIGQLSSGYFNFYSINASRSIAWCDKNGDIYCNINGFGFVRIKPGDFSNMVAPYDASLAIDIIDINDIKTTIGNTGISFPFMGTTDPTLNLPVFKVPSVSCASAMYTGSVWMGGTESGSGDLHLAAETYRQTGIDYKPGPIDLLTKTYDSSANSFYNRIWKINRETIDNFKANRNKPFYVIPKEIMEWPAHGKGNFTQDLAPFIDVDNNGKYEPLKGDHPKIKGDQMLWWVFNDLGAHTESRGRALGVEVHGSCYAYYYRDIPSSDSNAIVNRTIFFDYRIINRSNNNYNNFYTGIWNDVELGSYRDDHVGCDTLQNSSFGYNGDNNDEGRYGFGMNPPIIFCKLLNRKMSRFMFYQNNGNPVTGNPDSDTDYYNYMKLKSKIWGSYMSTSPICDTKNSGGGSNDMRSLMSCNTTSLRKDSVFDVEFAYILLHDPNINWLKEGCDKPTQTLARIQNWYNKKSFPSRPYYSTSVEPVEEKKHAFLIYPNPANTTLNLNADIASEEIKSIEIFDNNGRLVFNSLPDINYGLFSQTIDIRSFSSGIYIVKINSDKGVLAEKLVKE